MYTAPKQTVTRGLFKRKVACLQGKILRKTGDYCGTNEHSKNWKRSATPSEMKSHFKRATRTSERSQSNGDVHVRIRHHLARGPIIRYEFAFNSRRRTQSHQSTPSHESGLIGSLPSFLDYVRVAAKLLNQYHCGFDATYSTTLCYGCCVSSPRLFVWCQSLWFQTLKKCKVGSTRCGARSIACAPKSHSHFSKEKKMRIFYIERCIVG